VAKTPDFAIFGLQHCVVLPLGGIQRNLNAGAQLQTFPYPTVSKLFLFSSKPSGRNHAHNLSFKGVTDTQTLTQKLSVFGC